MELNSRKLNRWTDRQIYKTKNIKYTLQEGRIFITITSIKMLLADKRERYVVIIVVKYLEK